MKTQALDTLVANLRSASRRGMPAYIGGGAFSHIEVRHALDILKARDAEMEQLRAALWAIATTTANSNSEPDSMGEALDYCINIAQTTLGNINKGE